MSELGSVILRELKRALRTLKEDDIYGISFLVGENGIVPGKPTLTVGYNTESCYLNAIAFARNEEEARWNYSFWLQNTVAEWGFTEKSADLIATWLKETGLNEYSGDDYYVGYKFVEELTKVAEALHKEGDIQGIFQKDITILIHDFEYCYKTIRDKDVQDHKKADTDFMVDLFKSLQ